MSELVGDLIQRAKRVQQSQSIWHQHWDDLARVMIPRLLGFAQEMVLGVSRVDEIFDGTPMRAARGFANALAAMLRPEGEKWVVMKTEDKELEEDDDARHWLEDSNDRFRNALDNPKARVRDTLGATDLSLAVFGTGSFFIGDSPKGGNLHFRPIHLKESGIDWDEDEDAYAFYRYCSYTARQAEERFGFANLGAKAVDLLKNKKFDTQLKYIHAVLPRKDRMLQGGVFAKNMAFASYWIEEDSKHIVSESGFHEFPYIIPRMELAPKEQYGRGPGGVALPDANTLQAMGETLLIAGQKAAEPPLMAPNDGSFSEANTFPGGISYYDVSIAAKVRGPAIYPLAMGGNIPITREMQNDTRESVFAAFFKNILNLPVQGPTMTAEEVRARKEEFLREVGPLFGRLESNYTAAMTERAFPVMLRGGGFLPIPPSLQGRNLVFEYESPVKRIRKQVEAAIAAAWAREVIQIGAIKPEALDNLNVDAYVKFQHDAGRLPENLLLSDQQVADLRKQRSQQQEAQAQMDALHQGTTIAKTGADALKSAGMVNQKAA